MSKTKGDSMRSRLAVNVILVAVTRIASSAWAGDECSPSTLRGEYLVTGGVQARFDQRDNPTFPRITVSLWTFDGAGNFTAHAIQNNGGDYQELDTGGTYTVSVECIAVVTFPPELGDSVFKGVLTRDGSEADVIRMGPPDAKGRVNLATRHLKRSKD